IGLLESRGAPVPMPPVLLTAAPTPGCRAPPANPPHAYQDRLAAERRERAERPNGAPQPPTEWSIDAWHTLPAGRVACAASKREPAAGRGPQVERGDGGLRALCGSGLPSFGQARRLTVRLKDKARGEGRPSMSVYVGIDLHRKRSQVAILEPDGSERVNRNLRNNSPELVELLGALPAGTRVAFEAAYG